IVLEKRKRMDDELCRDEAPDDIQQLKVDLYYKALDLLLQKLNDRFSEESLLLYTQMLQFTETGLRATQTNRIQADDIKHLCCQYGLQVDNTAEELEIFRLYCNELFS